MPNDVREEKREKKKKSLNHHHHKAFCPSRKRLQFSPQCRNFVKKQHIFFSSSTLISVIYYFFASTADLRIKIYLSLFNIARVSVTREYFLFCKQHDVMYVCRYEENNLHVFFLVQREYGFADVIYCFEREVVRFCRREKKQRVFFFVFRL